MELLTDPEAWISLLTLTLMEIVLGIDNIIFISILTHKLPKQQQPMARRLGLTLALGTRLALLVAISWMMQLTAPLLSVMSREVSGRDLILLLGGLFLIGKSTHEIYEKLEAEKEEQTAPGEGNRFVWVLVQIMLLDIVFSLDSVITAVGMVDHISIMVVAMVVAVGVMLVSANGISEFVNRHPSMKILALAFLLLIGVMLVAEGLGQHIGKGYIYFAMAFSLLVELLNMRLRKKHRPVPLNRRFEAPTSARSTSEAP
jgi:predicted tellurium resistance membrane protein TerC